MKPITEQEFAKIKERNRLYLIYTLLCKLLPEEEAPAKKKGSRTGGN